MTFSGVPAGHVTSVEFDSQDPSVVLVAVNLEPEIPIVTGVKATIVRSALGGTANISLDGATHDALPIVAAKTGSSRSFLPRRAGFLVVGRPDSTCGEDQPHRGLRFTQPWCRSAAARERASCGARAQLRGVGRQGWNGVGGTHGCARAYGYLGRGFATVRQSRRKSEGHLERSRSIRSC